MANKYKIGDKVKFKDDADQWTCMFDITIQKVNNDGTYDLRGRNPHLKRQYGTEYCCTLRVKECNLERDSDAEKQT
jgi:hypothetical protein